MQPNLSPEQYAAIAGILRDTIAADRFPLSPRVRRWKAILDKLRAAGAEARAAAAFEAAGRAEHGGGPDARDEAAAVIARA